MFVMVRGVKKMKEENSEDEVEEEGEEFMEEIEVFKVEIFVKIKIFLIKLDMKEKEE